MKLTATLSALLLSATIPGALHAQAKSPARAGLSGERILQLTREYITAAPKRYVGAPGHTAAENFIRSHFAPEIAKGQFETDQFTPNTVLGPRTMRNFIVRYPGKKDGVLVIASHYETNYPLKDIPFVGANDGGCTTAMLIALGEYFRAHPPEGYSVWLVFDDGEEALQQWGPSDSLYGTRHLAAKWSGAGILPRIKAFIVLDMLGDKDLNMDYDQNSTPALLEVLKQAARQTNHTNNVFKFDQQVEDDHIPFKQRGVPVLDMIDLDYGPHNNSTPDGYHHTAQDTLDKISARSLQISSDLLLGTLRILNQR